MLSIALTSVRLKKGRFGVLGRLLYKETVSYRAALTAHELGFLFPANLLPARFPTSPVLRAFTNAVLHCSSCAVVRATIKTASDRAEHQTERDNKVISDFAACMAQDELKTAPFHDVAVLPHPKETILRAIEREILREQHATRVEWLKAGATFLPFFQQDDAGCLPANVETESDQIAARIEAAVRLRNAREPWPPRRGR
jgi:hypothetical protein